MKNDDLENTATAAVHKVAIDYCDGLTAAGEGQRKAVLTSMGLIMGEAAIMAHAAELTADEFCQVAKILFKQAAMLARGMK